MKAVLRRGWKKKKKNKKKKRKEIKISLENKVLENHSCVAENA